jgi:hypothetical protein
VRNGAELLVSHHGALQHLRQSFKPNSEANERVVTNTADPTDARLIGQRKDWQTATITTR